MLRGVWGDEGRFYRAYFKQFANKGYYATGDRAKRDEDGDIWILGRADDVINVAGHRLSTAGIESVIGSAYDVAETAVIGVPDVSKGEVVVAYVVVCGHRHDCCRCAAKQLRGDTAAWQGYCAGASMGFAGITMISGSAPRVQESAKPSLAATEGILVEHVQSPNLATLASPSCGTLGSLR